MPLHYIYDALKSTNYFDNLVTLNKKSHYQIKLYINNRLK